MYINTVTYDLSNTVTDLKVFKKNNMCTQQEDKNKMKERLHFVVLQFYQIHSCPYMVKTEAVWTLQKFSKIQLSKKIVLTLKRQTERVLTVWGDLKLFGKVKVAAIILQKLVYQSTWILQHVLYWQGRQSSSQNRRHPLFSSCCTQAKNSEKKILVSCTGSF